MYTYDMAMFLSALDCLYAAHPEGPSPAASGLGGQPAHRLQENGHDGPTHRKRKHGLNNEPLS